MLFITIELSDDITFTFLPFYFFAVGQESIWIALNCKTFIKASFSEDQMEIIIATPQYFTLSFRRQVKKDLMISFNF